MSNSALPIIIMYLLSSSECSLRIITDDSNFVDSYPSSTRWSIGGSNVGGIEILFTMARAKDITVSVPMKLPPQTKWDTMNTQEKALYILNRERYDRGIKPFAGYHSDVSGVAQNYAQHLYDTDTFSHEEDGTPWERLDRVAAIANNKDFFAYAENLAARVSGRTYVSNPAVQSIFNWIYNDAGSSWGHRKFCLATGLSDNNGDNGSEGLIGIGIVEGTDYNYSNWYGYPSSVIVMNAFDPSNGWDKENDKTVSLCEETNPESTRFSINYNDYTISDAQSGLMWTLVPVGQATPSDGINICNNSSHAGYSGWLLPNMAQSASFHLGMDSENRTPPQTFEDCIAESVSDGYIRTKRYTSYRGGNPGDSINFSGGANIRCYRSIP